MHVFLRSIKITNWKNDSYVKYHAEIINVSLKDKSIIDKYSIYKYQKRFLGLVRIYTIIEFYDFNELDNFPFIGQSDYQKERD